MTNPPTLSADKARRLSAYLRKSRIDGFPNAIWDAYHGKTKDLCEFLRSDLPLSENNRDQLAQLIDRRLQSRRRGRPRGRIVPPNQVVVEELIYRVKKKLNQRRLRNGGRIRKGIPEMVLGQEFERLADEYFLDSKDFDFEQILRRITRRAGA